MRLAILSCVGGLFVGLSYAGEVCTPVECLRRLNVAVRITRVELTRWNAGGRWDICPAGRKLSGWSLCRLEDGSCASTEWATSSRRRSMTVVDGVSGRECCGFGATRRSPSLSSMTGDTCRCGRGIR